MRLQRLKPRPHSPAIHSKFSPRRTTRTTDTVTLRLSEAHVVRLSGPLQQVQAWRTSNTQASPRSSSTRQAAVRIATQQSTAYCKPQKNIRTLRYAYARWSGTPSASCVRDVASAPPPPRWQPALRMKQKTWSVCLCARQSARSCRRPQRASRVQTSTSETRGVHRVPWRTANQNASNNRTRRGANMKQSETRETTQRQYR